MVPAAARKYLQVAHRHIAHRGQQARRGRPLQRQGGHALAHVLDRGVQAARVFEQPAQVGVGRRPPEAGVGQARHRAVVDHLAVVVAPRRVVDLPDGHLRGITRDDAVHEAAGIRPVQVVLEERRDVDEAAAVPDRVVLVLVMRLEGAHRVETGPVAEAEAAGQGQRARVKGGADRHRPIIGEPAWILSVHRARSAPARAARPMRGCRRSRALKDAARPGT